ncbi:MAG: hypothetical protein RLZZ347_519 [Candidatus Parcubacteria bacterium]|jgi:Tfp pilus assembly protein FimT
MISFSKGISVLELLITVAIVTLLVSISLKTFGQFFTVQSVDKEVGAVLSTIAYARSQSMAGRNDTSYGVHFASTTITVFRGSTYTVSTTTNIARELSGGVVVSRLSLGAGVVDVVFGKLTGTASASGTIMISSTRDSTQSKTITISGTGLAQ